MNIVLNPGDMVEIKIESIPGSFHIVFDVNEVRIETELPDDEGREGVIYKETIGPAPKNPDNPIRKGIRGFLEGLKK